MKNLEAWPGVSYYNELALMCLGGYDREVFVTLLSDIH